MRRLLTAWAMVMMTSWSSWGGAVEAQLGLEAGFSAAGGFPQGAFADAVSRTGLGLTGHARLRPGGGILLVGIDGGFLIYDVQNSVETIAVPGGDVSAAMTVTNYLIPIHLSVRLEPAGGVLRPFIEGLAGWKYFYTRAELSTVWTDIFRPVAVSTSLGDFAPDLGVGGGIHIRLREGRGTRRREPPPEEPEEPEEEPDPDSPWGQAPERLQGARPGEMLLGLSLHYLGGSRGTYLTDAQISFDGVDVGFDPVTSRTPLLLVRIGLTYTF